MLMLKVCHTCDAILGEIEIDDLTGDCPNPIMDVVGNVAYTLCPNCLRQMNTEPKTVYH